MKILMCFLTATLVWIPHTKADDFAFDDNQYWERETNQLDFSNSLQYIPNQTPHMKVNFNQSDNQFLRTRKIEMNLSDNLTLTVRVRKQEALKFVWRF